MEDSAFAQQSIREMGRTHRTPDEWMAASRPTAASSDKEFDK